LTIEVGERPVLEANDERGRREYRKDDENDGIRTPKES
jgi:hypothetical protein